MTSRVMSGGGDATRMDTRTRSAWPDNVYSAVSEWQREKLDA
jgi:hypothetical protein